MKIRTRRTIQLPDELKIERFRRAPDLGPHILFFSGGSALKRCCYELVKYTHNSIHIITPFDSGGSSAVLREVFEMPAIGDIRNRLLALSDRGFKGNHEIVRLFSHRFPAISPSHVLRKELDEMVEGSHPMVSAIYDPMRKIIRHYLSLFTSQMPEDFDLRKASVGNLILSGGYLGSSRRFDATIYIFSMLVKVQGTVRPVVNKPLHLVAELENGEVVVGQHMLTGKEHPVLSSAIKNIYVSEDKNTPSPCRPPIRNKMKDLINSAELICYPMGSLYTSIIANFLPQGVGTAVSRTGCPKIYIPNTLDDPESYLMTIEAQIDDVIRYLRQDDPEHILPGDVLNFVLVDKKNSKYRGALDDKKYSDMGIEIVDCPLVSHKSRPYIDEDLLVPILLSFV